MKKGSTRWVFFIGSYAVKIPSLIRWKNFLWGLLANIQEAEFSRCADMRPKLCPVLFSFPLGFLVVMPKARILKVGEITKDELACFCMEEDFTIPAELKWDSFGYLDGRLVAVDYG